MSILLQIGVKSESLLHNRIPAATNGLDAVEVALAAAEDEAAYHPPPQPTYASCYGLPYQDHNYGAPPPPTPPASPPPLVTKLNGHIEVEDLGSTAVVTTTETFPEVPPPSEPVDDSITRCICNFQHDDGYMICCDKCGVWQHVDCMGVDRANIPDTYRCELCEPRKVDKNRAILIQTRKREELSVGSSTESETETKQGALKKGKKTKMAVRDLDRFKKKNLIKREKKTSPIQKENRKLLKKELTPKKPVVRALKGNRSNSAPASQNTVPPNNIVEKYEEANSNRYSPNVQNILASRKTNGAHSHVGESKSSAKLLDQLCTVAQISANAKGLEASEDLSSNQGIVEYRGHVKLQDQIDKENGTDPLPFILYYTKFDDLQLCVDARVYGNDARYIRRSCCPNAEVRHVLENGKLFFFIYSSKSIPKGAEVTIPFDFNLHSCKKLVDCPCARASCPVARKRRRLDLQNQKAMKKQKRASKSSDCTPAAPAPPVADELPVSTLPMRRRRRSSPSRAPPLPPPPAEPVETKTPKSPVKEPVPQKVEETSPPLPVSPDVKHETDEGGEPRKKMTREERKMEAIMKAFEKLEKREERRKEALARLEHVKKKEEKVVKVEPPEPQEVPEPAQAAPEEKPPPVEVKSEKPKHVIKGKKGRKGHGTPARRRSRYNSCSSGVETTASLSAEENSSHATQPTTPVSAVPVTPVPAEPTPSQPVTPLGFRFPKTKKQMMSEWLSESGQEVQKPLTIKTEPLEVNTNTEEEEMAEYVKCLPSPHTTLNHLRRNSLSSSQKECTATRAAPSLDTRRGSAKKRWLRQAMCESGGTSSPVQGSFSPLHSGALSPNPQAPQNSPGASPIADFVTPLKKRRLARESLSAEGPYPPTPSTPSGAGFSHSLDHEDTSQHSNSGETSQQAVSASSSHRNGFQPHHFSPLTPVTPSDNLFERFEGDDMKSQGSSSAKEPLVNGKSPSFEVREDEEADGECSEELVSPDSAASDIGETDCKRPDNDAQCDSTMGVLRNSTCDSACVLETIAEEPSESQQSSCVQNAENSDSPTAQAGLPCTTCTDPKIVVESSDSTGSCQPDQTSEELVDTTSISPGPSSQSNVTVSVSSASVSASSDSSSSCQMNDLPYETPIADSSETATSVADLPPQPSGSSHLDASTGVSGSPSQGCVVAGPSNSECSEFRQEEAMDVGDSSRTEPSSSNELVHHKETDQCSVMACSSSSPNNKISAEISSEVLPVVSHSTDSTDCSGATVSTSQDSNSSILVCDSVDNEVKEDCSAEISSSKGPIVFREEESELEEGEIVSSEDEQDVSVEGEKSKCENADSSSGNAVSNRHRQVSGESATSSSSSHEEQNDVCSGSGEPEESERACWPTCSQVDSTSCHSTKESLVNSGVDSTVSGRELEGSVVISSNQTDSMCACPASSSVTSLTDTSSNSVPCSSSHVSQASSASSKAAAQGKKKVSLLEYRQRMRLKSQDSPSPGCSRGGGNKTSGSNSNSAGPSSVTLAPLPLFDCSPAQEATARPPRGQKEAKEDSRWTVSATLAERHRENAQMSLTERLRKEFGLSDDSEDDENKERHKSSPRRPKQLPPPPPPPPNNLPPPPPPPMQIAAGGPGVVFHPGVVGTPSPGVPPLPPPPVAIGAAARVPPSPVSPVVSVQSNIMPVVPPSFGGIPPPPPPHVVTPAGPPPVPSLPPPPVTQTSVAGSRPASHAIPPLMSLPSYPTKHFSSNLVSGRPGTPGAGQSPAASVPAQPFPPAPGPPQQGYQFQQGEAANGSEVFPPVVFEEQAETSSASQVYQQPMAFIEQVEPASSQQFTGYTQPPPSYVETPGEGTEPSSTSGPYQYPMVPQPPNIASTQSQNSQHNPHSLLNISKSQRQQ